MPPRWLRNLQLNKVALVDEGDNPSAHIVMFKRKSREEDVVDPKELRKALGLAEDATDAEVLAKSKELAKNAPDPADKDKTDPEVEKIKKEKDDAVAEAERLKKALAAATGNEPEPTPTDIFKNVSDPVVKAHLERLQKEKDDALKESAELKKSHEEEVEKRAEREAVEKLTPITNRLPVKPEEFVKHLRVIEKADSDAAAEVVRVLTAANELVQKGMLGALGSDAAPTGDGPEAKLESLAKARATEKGESFEVAYEAVSKTDEGQKLMSEALSGPTGGGA